MPDQPPQMPGVPPDRDRRASERDRMSDARDMAAQIRDEEAASRDSHAQVRDDRAGRIDVDAAADRSSAAADRRAARGDRIHARGDRVAARTDRALSAGERVELVIDDVTGAYTRAAGVEELRRELVKAERTQRSFVLAFLDIDGLKAVNDSAGHAAGDSLLREVVDCVRHVVREYDILVRYGGDEFLCGLPDMDIAEVADRLNRAEADLHERAHASVSIGLVEREPGEGLTALVARADAAMYASRGVHGAGVDSQGAPPG